ncbi:hypothetical protein [Spirilliplanes yamanashiensis]|uniref:Uncharacterized protein n=1 Tax=Spirilliplanes yamanashiensis TaxID=42233 RepID=A0A8J3Y580_9ACTN|nr:hypothetical protein [Spirilliplanes yamanashiensis]MDP9819556.1 hypothetical protein [Spirilliplanes yamanashiensis]GIJ01622.1 hypothetical protein Sya03_09740 [Spirilliplanes yamanashiensis]
MTTTLPRRFRDDVPPLHRPADDPVDVVCPACSGHATVRPWPDGGRRLSCRACAHVRDLPAGAPPCCRAVRLWLVTRCRGGELWALNERHLDLLERYVGAGLRERTAPGMSLVARLPAWIKAGRHRGDVLRGIARLRSMLDGPR